MNRLRCSAGKLEFRHYPIDRWLLIAFIFFMQIASVMSYYTTPDEHRTLTCTRSQPHGNCQISTMPLFPPQLKILREFPLADIQTAAEGWDDKQRCYQVYLQLKNGQTSPLLIRCGNKADRLKNRSNEINAFLASATQPSVRVDAQANPLLVSALHILWGIPTLLWVLLFEEVQVLVATFDQTQGLVTFQRLGLFKRTSITYELRDISRAEVTEEKPDWLSRGSYRLNLRFRSHPDVALTSARIFSEGTRHSLKDAGDRINQFLKTQ
jgi:hypothetical protein